MFEPDIRALLHRVLAGLVAIVFVCCTAGCAENSGNKAGTDPDAEAASTPGKIVATMDFRSIAPARTQRVVFHSKAADETPTAVSGTLLWSNTEWKGFPNHPESAKKTPLAIIAPGTLGMSDHCAASVALRYQAPPTPPAEDLLKQGWNVAIVDYEGLGTPGGHAYMNRLSAGQTVLDMARSALGGMDLPDDTPIALLGYSQGGGAVASAAELAQHYAPELNIKAVYAGAIPVDLKATAHHITNSALAGLVGYAINGLIYAYPELHDTIYGMLSPLGKDYLSLTAGECIGDTVRNWPRNDTRAFTADGETLAEALDNSRDQNLHQRIAQQRLGTIAPTMPVFVTHNAADDVLPVGPARDLVRQWKEAGAEVTYVEVNQPLGNASHGLAYQLTIDQAKKWLDARMVE